MRLFSIESAFCAGRASGPFDMHGPGFQAGRLSRLALAGLMVCPVSMAAQAVSPTVGAVAPVTQSQPVPVRDDVSERHRREAERAYVKGAQAMDRKELAEAEKEFAQAVRLDPGNHLYPAALSMMREHRLAELVHRAARANAQGQKDAADHLLVEARAIDPNNPVVEQHFFPDGSVIPAAAAPAGRPQGTLSAGELPKLAPPVKLTPSPGVHDLHLRASAHDLITQVCEAFGIRTVVVNSIGSGPVLRLDLDHADFEQALRAVETLTRTFSVPLQPTELLFSRDAPDYRAAYEPLVEETLYLPGLSQADLNECATMVRNIFNLRVVNAVSSTSSLVLRGDEATLGNVNATFATLLEGDAEVLLELSLFEVDRSRISNLGVQLPSSAGAFPIYSTAESLISANQSLISQAIANNLITLTGVTYTDTLTELEFLLASGAVSSSQFSNLLGVFGRFGGLPLAGAFLGSSTTLNAALTASDLRMLDTLQLRLGDKQEGQFRAGTRYPIETGIYSSGVSSSLSSAVAGLSINGTSVSSLLSQYSGATSVSVPQFQYEDLGLTLKATVHVLRSGDVQLKLDFKIEALGSGSINTLPILNNRQFTSTVTIPQGQTALLANQVSTSELRAVTGLPFLSEIPGFQSTNRDTEKDSTELMITLTPHLVRSGGVRVSSRRLLAGAGGSLNAQ